jgi:hypothetical protein
MCFRSEKSAVSQIFWIYTNYSHVFLIFFLFQHYIYLDSERTEDSLPYFFTKVYIDHHEYLLSDSCLDLLILCILLKVIASEQIQK